MRAWAGENFRSGPAISKPFNSVPLDLRPPEACSNQTRKLSPSGVACRYKGPEYSIFSPYAMALAASASRRATSCLLVAWIFLGIPMSMVTAMPVLAKARVWRCASRTSGHMLCGEVSKLASCTKRKGKSPCPHARDHRSLWSAAFGERWQATQNDRLPHRLKITFPFLDDRLRTNYWGFRVE